MTTTALNAAGAYGAMARLANRGAEVQTAAGGGLAGIPLITPKDWDPKTLYGAVNYGRIIRDASGKPVRRDPEEVQRKHIFEAMAARGRGQLALAPDSRRPDSGDRPAPAATDGKLADFCEQARVTHGIRHPKHLAHPSGGGLF